MAPVRKQQPDALWGNQPALPSLILIYHGGLFSASARVYNTDFASKYAIFAEYCYSITSSDKYDFAATQYESVLVRKDKAYIHNKSPLSVVGFRENLYVLQACSTASGYGGLPASIALSNHTLAYQIYTPSFGTRLVNLSNSSNITTTKRSYLLVSDSNGSYSVSAGWTGQSTGYVFYVNTTARTSNVQSYVDRTNITAIYLFNEANRMYISNLGWRQFTLSTATYQSKVDYPAELTMHPAVVTISGTNYAISQNIYPPASSHGYLGEVYKAAATTFALIDYDKGPIARPLQGWFATSVLNAAPYNKVSFTGTI